MSRYSRHNPEEPIRHDWLAGARMSKTQGSFAAPTGLAGVKPKCKHCGDTGMIRNDQSDQGWDDCIWCSK